MFGSCETDRKHWNVIYFALTQRLAAKWNVTRSGGSIASGVESRIPKGSKIWVWYGKALREALTAFISFYEKRHYGNHYVWLVKRPALRRKWPNVTIHVDFPSIFAFVSIDGEVPQTTWKCEFFFLILILFFFKSEREIRQTMECSQPIAIRNWILSQADRRALSAVFLQIFCIPSGEIDINEKAQRNVPPPWYSQLKVI